MKQFVLAKSAGFCFGVRRSVAMAEKELENCSQCYSLGELIHNNDVIDYLKSKGLKITNDISTLSSGDRIIIRAHGVGEETYRALYACGTQVVDATCPKVKEIHRIVRNASDNGEQVIVIGMPDHPEVTAICGWGNSVIVAENTEVLKDWFHSRSVCGANITIVSQTTQTRENFNKCTEYAKKICTNVKIFDTICNATSVRQKEAAELASECDAMVVIGGKHSANSVHLADICRENCGNVQFVERAEEIDTSRLRSADIVGITAGASTPAWIIKEVVNKMDEIKVEEKELSFDEMLEETLKTIYNGDKVTGQVVAITTTEISVDLGTKYSGFIPTTEFTDEGVKVEDAVKIGDTIEAIVVRVNDVEGTAQLSKKRLDAQKIWTDIDEAVEKKSVLEGVVSEANKGGVVINLKGVRVFVPASHTDLPKDADLSEMIGKTVRFNITEVNKARKRVVGSIRNVARAERRERNEAIWSEIEVGKKYSGTVKSLTSYGAFVDIGGIDGMVHVSELSWGRIHQPSEVVSVGDEIEVYVINFDREKRKISLGYKDPNGNPWEVFKSKYAEGDVAAVKVVKLMQFGAFAEVVPGVDGLIHISQLADRRVAKPDDVVSVGDVVDAKIIAIDEENHKVSLSIRALAAAETEAEEE